MFTLYSVLDILALKLYFSFSVYEAVLCFGSRAPVLEPLPYSVSACKDKAQLCDTELSRLQPIDLLMRTIDPVGDLCATCASFCKSENIKTQVGLHEPCACEHDEFAEN